MAPNRLLHEHGGDVPPLLATVLAHKSLLKDRLAVERLAGPDISEALQPTKFEGGFHRATLFGPRIGLNLADSSTR